MRTISKNRLLAFALAAVCAVLLAFAVTPRAAWAAETQPAAGTYTVTANLWLSASDASAAGFPVLAGLAGDDGAAYMTNATNPMGAGGAQVGTPTSPVSDNATLTVAEDGTATLTVPVVNPVFTLQKVGTNAELGEIATHSVDGNFGGATSRIDSLGVNLPAGKLSGDWVLADSQFRPAIQAIADIYGTMTVPMHLTVDASNVPTKQVDEPTAKTFSDVQQGDWYKDAVDYVSAHGIMNGIGGTDRFEPGTGLSREMAAQIFYNYMGNGAVAPASTQSDVHQDGWYAKAVNWCVSTGVMKGYGSESFGVGSTLSRAEAACLFAQAVNADLSTVDTSVLNSFPDASDVPDWAQRQMAWAVQNGIIHGVGGTSLAPYGTIDRAQMAQIMANALQNGVLK